MFYRIRNMLYALQSGAYDLYRTIALMVLEGKSLENARGQAATENHELSMQRKLRIEKGEAEELRSLEKRDAELLAAPKEDLSEIAKAYRQRLLAADLPEFKEALRRVIRICEQQLNK